LVTLVDEFREFRLGPDAAVVASASRLADSFLADRERVPELPLNPMRDGTPILVHGHCHQKATMGTSGTLAALGRIPGARVRELDSGCCGMAGSFGYDHRHYDVSVALANRVILPSLEAEPSAVLAAPGYSCRSQVHGLSGREALHPLELMRGCLRAPGRDAMAPEAVSGGPV
jgi:Fe-S oxidoreductase